MLTRDISKRDSIYHIVFDLDGTLVKIPVPWREVYSKLSKELGRDVSSIVALYEEIWKTEKYKIVSRIVEDYELKAIEHTVVLDNSPLIVKELSKKYTLSLVTLQSSRVMMKILRKFSMEDYFIVKVSRDITPIRYEQIVRVLEEAHIPSHRTLVIGDLLNDVRAAIRAGCKAMLIDRENKSEKEYVIVNGKYRVPVIRRLNEIRAFLS